MIFSKELLALSAPQQAFVGVFGGEGKRVWQGGDFARSAAEALKNGNETIKDIAALKAKAKQGVETDVDTREKLMTGNGVKNGTEKNRNTAIQAIDAVLKTNENTLKNYPHITKQFLLSIAAKESIQFDPNSDAGNNAGKGLMQVLASTADDQLKRQNNPIIVPKNNYDWKNPEHSVSVSLSNLVWLDQLCSQKIQGYPQMSPQGKQFILAAAYKEGPNLSNDTKATNAKGEVKKYTLKQRGLDYAWEAVYLANLDVSTISISTASIEGKVLQIPNILRQAQEQIIQQELLRLKNSTAESDLGRILTAIGNVKIPLEGATPESTIMALKDLASLKTNHKELLSGKIILGIPPTLRNDGSVKQTEIDGITSQYPALKTQIDLLFVQAPNRHSSDPRQMKFKDEFLKDLNNKLGSTAIPNPFQEIQPTAARDAITKLWKDSRSGEKLVVDAGKDDPLKAQAQERLEEALKQTPSLTKDNFDIHTNDSIANTRGEAVGSHIDFFDLKEASDDLNSREPEKALTAFATILAKNSGIKIDDRGNIVAPELTSIDYNRVKLQAVINQLFDKDILSPKVLQTRFPNNYQKGEFTQMRESRDVLFSAENLKYLALVAHNSKVKFNSPEEFQKWAQKMLGTYLDTNGNLKPEWETSLTAYNEYQKEVANVQQLVNNKDTTALLSILAQKKAALALPKDKALLDKINAVEQVFGQSESIARKQQEAKTQIKLSDAQLQVALSELDNTLKQTITKSQTEIISAKLEQQEGITGWAFGKMYEWHADRKLVSMKEAEGLNQQAVTTLQEYAVYIAQKEGRTPILATVAAQTIGKIEFLKTQRKQETDKAKQDSLDKNINDQKLILAEYGKDLGIIAKNPGEAITAKDADEVTYAKLTNVSENPPRFFGQAETNKFIDDLYQTYHTGFVMGNKEAKLTETQFKIIFDSTYHKASAVASLKLQDCYQSQIKTGGAETIASLILDASSAKLDKPQIELENAKQMQQLGSNQNALEATKLIASGASESELKRAYGIVNDLTQKIDSENKSLNGAELSQKYREALSGQGWFTDNMSGGFKLLLFATLAAAAFKNPKLAGQLMLGAGALTFATGSKDPLDALSKLMPKAGDAAEKALAKMGWFERGEWQPTADKYGVELGSKDILAFNVLKNVNMQHVMKAVDDGGYNKSEWTLDQLGTDSNKPRLQPGLLSLVMKQNGMTESLGLSEMDMENALKKILIMRGGAEKNANASKYLVDGYQYLKTDINGGELGGKKIIGNPNMTFYEWTYSKVKNLDSANKWGTLAQMLGVGAETVKNVGTWFAEAGNNGLNVADRSWKTIKRSTFDALSIPNPDPKNPGKNIWFFQVKSGPHSGSYVIDALGNLKQVGKNFMATGTGEALKTGVRGINDALDYFGLFSADNWEPKESYTFDKGQEKQKEQFETLVRDIDKSFYPLYAAVGYAEEDFGKWIIPVDAVVREPWKNMRTGNGGAFEDNRAKGQVLSARMAVIQEIFRKTKAGVPADVIKKETLNDADKHIMNVITQIVDSNQSTGKVKFEGKEFTFSEWRDAYKQARDSGDNDKMYNLIKAFEDTWYHSSFVFDFRNISNPEDNARIFAQLNNIGVPQVIQGTIDKDGNLEKGKEGDIHKFEAKLLAAYNNNPRFKPNYTSPHIDDFHVDPWGPNWTKGGGELFGQTMFLYKEFLSTAVNTTTGVTEKDYDKYKDYLEKNIAGAAEHALPFTRLTVKELRNRLEYYKNYNGKDTTTEKTTTPTIEEKKTETLKGKPVEKESLPEGVESATWHDMPHVIVSPNGEKLPAKGYIWKNLDEKNYEVVPQPGTTVPKESLPTGIEVATWSQYPNVIQLGENQFAAAKGYEFKYFDQQDNKHEVVRENTFKIEMSRLADLAKTLHTEVATLNEKEFPDKEKWTLPLVIANRNILSNLSYISGEEQRIAIYAKIPGLEAKQVVDTAVNNIKKAKTELSQLEQQIKTTETAMRTQQIAGIKSQIQTSEQSLQAITNDDLKPQIKETLQKQKQQLSTWKDRLQKLQSTSA